MSRHAARTASTRRSRTIRRTAQVAALACAGAIALAACGHTGGGPLITAKTRTELLPHPSAPSVAVTPNSTAPIGTSRHKRTTPTPTHHTPIPAATAEPARRATPTTALPPAPPPGPAPPQGGGGGGSTGGSTGGGKPGPGNTGVPAGTALTVRNGDLHITKAGTVLDAQDIRGFVFIEAANVTIKRSIIRGGRVTSGNIGLVNDTGGRGTNFALTDSELSPTNPSVYLDGIKGSNYALTRVNIHGTVDGAKVFEGGNVTIQNSWLHDEIYYASDPNQGGGHSHNDGVQVLSGSNIRILNNTITGAYNAGMQVTQGQGAVSGLLFSGNWADGGGCTINIAHQPLASLSGVTLSNNRFGRATRNPNCPMLATTKSHVSDSGNVWDDNGKPVKVRYA